MSQNFSKWTHNFGPQVTLWYPLHPEQFWGLWTLKIDRATQPFLVFNNMRHSPFLKSTGQHGTFLKSTGQHCMPFLKINRETMSISYNQHATYGSPHPSPQFFFFTFSPPISNGTGNYLFLKKTFQLNKLSDRAQLNVCGVLRSV